MRTRQRQDSKTQSAQRQLLVFLVSWCLCVGFLDAQTTVNINDTLRNADNTLASGRLEIFWPAFKTAGGFTVAPGRFSYTVTNGVVNLNLFPNAGAAPSGTSYRVNYYLTSGAGREYWVVPATGPVTIGDIRVSVAPSPALAVGVGQLPAGSPNQLFKTNTAGSAVEQATLTTGTAGTDFNVAFGVGTITLSLPDASATNRGAVTTGAQTFAGVKTLASPVLAGTPVVGDGAGNDKLEFIEEASNPTCAAGDYFVWANSGDGRLKKCQNGSISDLDTGGGGGHTITVNGSALASATAADLDDATPAAPANGFNIKWQKDALDPTNISGYLDTTTLATSTWGSGSAITFTYDVGAVDPIIAFTSGNIKYSGATTYTYEGGATDPVWTPGNGVMNLSTGTLQQGGNAVETQNNKDAASGYAGLTASTKLVVTQGQEVWALADLTGVTGVTGSGTLVVLGTSPTLAGTPVIGDGAGNDKLEFIEEASNPTCAAGQYFIWSNSTDNKLKKCQNGAISDLDTGGGGGHTITVNGSALASATAADFDDALPAAPANGFNIKWQKDGLDPTNISGYLDTTTLATSTWGSGSAITFTYDVGAVDPVLALTSGNVKWSGATTYTYEGGATDPVWTPGNGVMNLSTGTLQQGGNAVELQSNKNAASGYAGLTAGTKLLLAQGQEVWAIADLTDYASKSGTGTAAIGSTITTPSANDFLQWSGTNWVNASPNAGTDLTADLEEEAHASEHQHSGGDEVATATPGANAIPKAGAGGTLAAGWVQEVLALADLTDVTGTTGSGTLAVLGTSPTLAGTPVIGDGAGNDKLEFIEEATNPTCAAGDYFIWANSGDLVLKKCQNGTISNLDLDTGGSPRWDQLIAPTAAVNLVANAAAEKLTGSNTDTTATNLYLSQFSVDSAHTSGTRAEAVVSDFKVTHSAAGGTVTDMAGIILRTNVRSAGTVTNNYGIKVENQAGVGTNNWAIFTGTGKVEFGDLVETAQNLTFKSGTSFLGTLDHAITANRTWTLPDATTSIAHAPAALTAAELLQGNGGAEVQASGFTMQAAGSAGTSVTNAGTATSLARSDHEHRVPWQVGAHFEATPAVAESTVPLPVNEACGGSIDATAVHITALTKGSAAMTFNVVRYNSAGTSQGNLFASNQSYSNTGNNRQSFTPDQNNTNIGSTDYFRVNFVTVNGQDDLTVATGGKCKNVN